MRRPKTTTQERKAVARMQHDQIAAAVATVRRMRLTVRIPSSIDPALTGNGTRSWAKHHRLFQDLKFTTGWALKASIPHASYPDDALPLRLDYVVARAKGRRELDDDNIKIGLKACQDAIALHLGINDRHMVIGTVEQIRDPEGIGWIEVCITPATADEGQQAA